MNITKMRTNEWTGERTHEWANGRASERANERAVWRKKRNILSAKYLHQVPPMSLTWGTKLNKGKCVCIKNMFCVSLTVFVVVVVVEMVLLLWWMFVCLCDCVVVIGVIQKCRVAGLNEMSTWWAFHQIKNENKQKKGKPKILIKQQKKLMTMLRM